MPDRDPIAYEVQTGISRRAVRWWIGLTIINSLVLILVIVGPISYRTVQQQRLAIQTWWTARQAAKAATARRMALLPVQQQCMDYAAAPGKLIYAEAPADVRRLGPATRPVAYTAVAGLFYVFYGGESLPMHRIDAAAGADPPCVAPFAPISKYIDSSHGLLFMHARRADANHPWRLVVLTVSTKISVAESMFEQQRNEQFCNFGLLSSRRFDGLLLSTVTETNEATVLSDPMVVLQDKEPAIVSERTPVQGGGLDSKRVGQSVDQAQPTSRLRLFAGQADQKDDSRFSIPYEFDPADGSAAKRGTFDGQVLPSDKLQLTPDQQLMNLFTVARAASYNEPNIAVPRVQLPP